jgi:ATP-dependent RNA helicase DHX8/PRP22
VHHLSWSKLKGYLKPGGNKDFSPSGAGELRLFGLEEFPAFPDLTIPFLGGIREEVVKNNNSAQATSLRNHFPFDSMADIDLYNLEFLSLVAKINQEIVNHTNTNDKTLAEFVISLHENSKSLPAFQEILKEVGADFPESFVENVDRLILSMHPKYKKRASATANKKAKAVDGAAVLSEQERQKRLFPGLAIQNKDVPPAVPDDVFLEELGDLVAGRKAKPRDTEDEERAPKRQRRDRSYSPRRRSPSPVRSRARGAEGRYGGGRSTVDDKPVLFKIYPGKISGLKDFGAFVTLEGVSGRVEGSYPQLI